MVLHFKRERERASSIWFYTSRERERELQVYTSYFQVASAKTIK